MDFPPLPSPELSGNACCNPPLRRPAPPCSSPLDGSAWTRAAEPKESREELRRGGGAGAGAPPEAEVWPVLVPTEASSHGWRRTGFSASGGSEDKGPPSTKTSGTRICGGGRRSNGR